MQIIADAASSVRVGAPTWRQGGGASSAGSSLLFPGRVHAARNAIHPSDTAPELYELQSLNELTNYSFRSKRSLRFKIKNPINAIYQWNLI